MTTFSYRDIYFSVSNFKNRRGGKEFDPTMIISQRNAYYGDLEKFNYLKGDKRIGGNLDKVYGAQTIPF